MTVITISILLTQKPEAKFSLLADIVEWTSSFRVMAGGPLDIPRWGEPCLEPARHSGALELILSTKEIWLAIWAIAKTVWLLREWLFANQAEFRSLRLHIQKQITKMTCHLEKMLVFLWEILAVQGGPTEPPCLSAYNSVLCDSCLYHLPTASPQV